jgi:hypothetical protein
MRTRREEEAPMAKLEGHGRAERNVKSNAGKDVTGKQGGQYSARRSNSASHSFVAKRSGGTFIAKVGSKLAGDDRETLKNEPQKIAGGGSNRQREALAKQFDRVQRTVSESVIDPTVVSVLLDDFAGFLVERAPRRRKMSGPG